MNKIVNLHNFYNQILFFYNFSKFAPTATRLSNLKQIFSCPTGYPAFASMFEVCPTGYSALKKKMMYIRPRYPAFQKKIRFFLVMPHWLPGFQKKKKKDFSVMPHTPATRLLYWLPGLVLATRLSHQLPGVHISYPAFISATRLLH